MSGEQCAKPVKLEETSIAMEPPAKRRKCVGEKIFDYLPRISCWDEIELYKVFKVKQVENGRAFLVSTREELITELPDIVLKKLSHTEDLSVYLKKTREDVIVCFKPKKMCTFCKNYYASSSSLTSHKRKCCKWIIKDMIEEC
jgi:hypothetical protein